MITARVMLRTGTLAPASGSDREVEAETLTQPIPGPRLEAWFEPWAFAAARARTARFAHPALLALAIFALSALVLLATGAPRDARGFVALTLFALALALGLGFLLWLTQRIPQHVALHHDGLVLQQRFVPWAEVRHGMVGHAPFAPGAALLLKLHGGELLIAGLGRRVTVTRVQQLLENAGVHEPEGDTF